MLSVSLRWIKLPPVWINSRDQVREVPYMRYGHSAVLIDDTVYIWGGRNDTEEPATCSMPLMSVSSSFSLFRAAAAVDETSLPHHTAPNLVFLSLSLSTK